MILLCLVYLLLHSTSNDHALFGNCNSLLNEVLLIQLIELLVNVPPSEVRASVFYHPLALNIVGLHEIQVFKEFKLFLDVWKFFLSKKCELILSLGDSLFKSDLCILL